MRKQLTMAFYICGVAASAAAMFAIAYLFYRHVGISIAVTPFATAFLPLYGRYRSMRQRKLLALQFRQFLMLLASALAAGRSLENAFLSAEIDLHTFLLSDSVALQQQLHVINSSVRNGQSIERAFHIFSAKSGLDDIQQFSEVLTVCKRSGGDLVEVIRQTAHVIADKMEMEREIMIMTANKRFEAKALAVVPLLLIALLALSSPEYMQPLYSGAGRVIMTMALAGFGLCCWWIASIIDLKV